MDTRARTLLGTRSFVALWIGQVVSNLGDKLLQINAIGVALAAAAGAGSAMAQILIWTTLPTLALGLVAGMVVDHANRQHVMIVSDLFRAALVAALPLADGWGVGAVCGVIACVAVAACFFGPARTALIPSTVAADQLVAANAWFAASGFVIALIGTAGGSWLLAGFGLTTSLWINAGVFGLSALVIALAKLRVTRPSIHSASRNVFNSPMQMTGVEPAQAKSAFRDGAQSVAPRVMAGHGMSQGPLIPSRRRPTHVALRHRAVRAVIAHYALLMGLATACYVGLVGLSGHTSGFGMKGVSLLLTAAIVGLIAGGFLAHRLRARLRLGYLISLGLLAIGAGAFGVARTDSVAGLMAWLVLIGAGGAIYAAVVDAALQRMTPDALRGRALAARGVLSNLVVLVVAATSGWLIDHASKTALFGAVATVALGGAVTVWWATTEGLIYRLVRWFFRQLSFAYLRLEVQGVEQIPAHGGAIIAGNHPNVLDGLLLLVASPRPVRFLIAEDLYMHRYLHGFFKALGMIPVYRTIPPPASKPEAGPEGAGIAKGNPLSGGGTKSHNGEALRGAIAALQRGELLGIFPEGTTAFRGAMQQVKKGVALLALRTGCPVVPLAIHGSAEAFPKGTKVPRHGTVRLRFEEPVRYAASEANPIPEPRVAEVLEDIRARILVVMRHAKPTWDFSMMPEWLKELQIALSALIVVPLSSFLTATANPSLDPNEGR